MRRPVVLGGFAAALLSVIVPAQEQKGPSQAELKSRREVKLDKDVFRNASWRTDFAAAREQAAAQDKLILVYFTRSYSP